MISPGTIVFAVGGVLRVGSALEDALEQRVRDQDVTALNLETANIPVTDLDTAARRLVQSDYRAEWEQDPELSARIRDALAHTADPDQAAFVKAEELRLRAIVAPNSSETGNSPSERAYEIALANYAIVRKWPRNGDRPPHPMVRVGIALVDVALDFVRTRGSTLGLSDDAELLATQLATNLQVLLPDTDDPADWPKVGLVERAASVVFSAGLRTLAEHPGAILDDEVSQQLVRAAVVPLWELVDEDPNRLPALERIRDTFLGPITQRTLTVIAERQATIFGRDLDPTAAAGGALLNAFLRSLAQDSLDETFTREGAARLYDALLGVVVDRPDLFVSLSNEQRQTLARELLSGVAEGFRSAHNPFRGTMAGVGRDVLIAGLDTLSKHSDLLFRESTDWKDLAEDISAQLLQGFGQGLSRGGSFPDALRDSVSPERLIDLARIAVARVAATPGMLTDKRELQRLIAAGAAAMAADDNLLLDRDGWRQVLAVLALEASRNPGALFPIDADDSPEHALGVKLIRVLLEGAAAGLEDGRRAAGTLLVGGTLAEAIGYALTHAAGKSEAAAANLEALMALTTKLNEAARANPGKLGAEDYLRLFRHLAGPVLERGAVEILDLEETALAAAAREVISPDELTSERVLELARLSAPGDRPGGATPVIG